MKRKLVFATNNKNKLREIRELMPSNIEVLSLADIHCEADIAETAETLEGNALIKAHYVYDKYGLDCFADDTGLEVDALGRQPGVHTARYAGESHDPNANMEKLLRELKENFNRHARFRTVIALIMKRTDSDQPEIHEFEGRIEGSISKEKKGNAGFGYDPIFVPDGYEESFAQLGEDVKNTISHRARAVSKLVDYLK